MYHPPTSSRTHTTHNGAPSRRNTDGAVSAVTVSPLSVPQMTCCHPQKGPGVSRYTTWQRLVHSVPRGERIAAAVMMETIKTNPITVPWPGDATPPGTLALAVRCHTVNVSIGVFLSDRYLFCRSDKRQLPLETIGNLVQNTIRGGTGAGLRISRPEISRREACLELIK